MKQEDKKILRTLVICMGCVVAGLYIIPHLMVNDDHTYLTWKNDYILSFSFQDTISGERLNATEFVVQIDILPNCSIWDQEKYRNANDSEWIYFQTFNGTENYTTFYMYDSRQPISSSLDYIELNNTQMVYRFTVNHLMRLYQLHFSQIVFDISRGIAEAHFQMIRTPQNATLFWTPKSTSLGGYLEFDLRKTGYLIQKDNRDEIIEYGISLSCNMSLGENYTFEVVMYHTQDHQEILSESWSNTTQDVNHFAFPIEAYDSIIFGSFLWNISGLPVSSVSFWIGNQTNIVAAINC